MIHFVINLKKEEIMPVHTKSERAKNKKKAKVQKTKAVKKTKKKK